MIDLALWLQPLDGANPSGEDLRNEPDFHELERLAEPQVKVAYDDNNKPSSEVTTPADWHVLLSKAEELRERGRDLRLIVLVTRALANEEGLAGLTQGLKLLAETIDLYWDNLHPALRSGSNPRDEALRRINALGGLQNGQGGLLEDLRQRVFYTARLIGPITGHDLERGTLNEQIVLNESAIRRSSAEQAAFIKEHEQLVERVRSSFVIPDDEKGAELKALQGALLEDAKAALAAFDVFDKSLKARIGGDGANVPDLKRFLERVAASLGRSATANQADKANGAASPDDAQGSSGSDAPVASVNGINLPGHAKFTTVVLPEHIGTREEVVQCLDLVISFYDRTEPSSPIPHLARRVRRMVHMDFIELMEDLAPSGLKEFRLLAGVPESKK